jgi:hypothetical protein
VSKNGKQKSKKQTLPTDGEPGSRTTHKNSANHICCVFGHPDPVYDSVDRKQIIGPEGAGIRFPYQSTDLVLQTSLIRFPMASIKTINAVRYSQRSASSLARERGRLKTMRIVFAVFCIVLLLSTVLSFVAST